MVRTKKCWCQGSAGSGGERICTKKIRFLWDDHPSRNSSDTRTCHGCSASRPCKSCLKFDGICGGSWTPPTDSTGTPPSVVWCDGRIRGSASRPPTDSTGSPAVQQSAGPAVRDRWCAPGRRDAKWEPPRSRKPRTSSHRAAWVAAASRRAAAAATPKSFGVIDARRRPLGRG